MANEYYLAASELRKQVALAKVGQGEPRLYGCGCRVERDSAGLCVLHWQQCLVDFVVTNDDLRRGCRVRKLPPVHLYKNQLKYMRDSGAEVAAGGGGSGGSHRQTNAKELQ